MRAPVLAIGDGALGFWASVREVWPETAEQRCWVHRIPNVLDKLAEEPVAERQAGAPRDAVCRDPARVRAEDPPLHRRMPRHVSQGRGRAHDGPPAATDPVNYPTEHWKHLRTTNPIESAFATVRLRERLTKGAGSRTVGLTMAFKLLEAAQAHWR
jgi:hypothetical protein